MNRKNRRRVTYRPGKTNGVFGIVWGGIFVCIGLFLVIPVFGPFGILWTLMALAITVHNAYAAFGKNYTGPEINIEEEIPSKRPEHEHTPVAYSYDECAAKKRLEQLETLKTAGLITKEEYDQKRKEILEQI